MRMLVVVTVDKPLRLPINYLHILQSIIYHSIGNGNGMSTFFHDEGYRFGKRPFRLFTFSWLQGKYEIEGKQIVFRNQVSFEVSSPENFLILKMMESIHRDGIVFGDNRYEQVEVLVSDETVEEEIITIKMKTPICVYSTMDDGSTYFYTPEDVEFGEMIDRNFKRKYTAYIGLLPNMGVRIEPVYVTAKDKVVTRYQGMMLSGYRGIYRLSGQRKYLDFLYQAGIGSKNAQGFGMFDLVEEV